MSKPTCLAPKTNYPEFTCGSPAVWTVVYRLGPGTPGEGRRRVYDACAQHLHKVCKRAEEQHAVAITVVWIED